MPRKGAKFNPSREDSELLPCPKCALPGAEEELAVALQEARTHIFQLEAMLKATETVLSMATMASAAKKS